MQSGINSVEDGKTWVTWRAGPALELVVSWPHNTSGWDSDHTGGFWLAAGPFFREARWVCAELDPHMHDSSGSVLLWPYEACALRGLEGALECPAAGSPAETLGSRSDS